MPRAPALPCAPVLAPVPPELCCCTLAPPPALPPPVCAMVMLDAATSAAAAVVAKRMRLIAVSSLFYRSGSPSAVTRQRPRASAVPLAIPYENTVRANSLKLPPPHGLLSGERAELTREDHMPRTNDQMPHRS